jgi:DNA-binding winged helix-turn-helix (wHTH) protein/predicted ATPase
LSPAVHYRFGEFRLDIANDRLWAGAAEIPVRAKTFAVLRHLVEHAGSLVSRDDLVRAVWNGAAGSEHLPKGCIRELRRLLRDETTRPRFIESLARRGYRFVAPVERIVARTADAAGVSTESHGPALLVAREAALRVLAHALGAAHAGTRRLVFITGEPGIGKSALLDAFLAESESAEHTLIAIGHCVEQHGIGEPYLPVLEALGRLGRSASGSRLVETLERYAPSWLTQLPGLARSSAPVSAQAAGGRNERMLREMGDALEVLTADTTLVLALEDLQWSDGATITLLASLTQRPSAARLLIVGTFRPADLFGPSQHLRALYANLRARALSDGIALPFLGRDDIASYLDARFPGHRLPHETAAVLEAVTDGNPLFLINVVRDLLVRGCIAFGETGVAELRVRPEKIAAEVPETLSGLIERRLDRVTDEDRRMLQAASAVGATFDASLLAAALPSPRQRVEERCRVLAEQGEYIEAIPSARLPDGSCPRRFAFVHSLYQRALYERLAETQRRRMHRSAAHHLERRYGARVGEAAAELAHHWATAGEAAPAVRHLLRASDNAMARLAPTEAFANLERGVALLSQLGDGADRSRLELMLQSRLAYLLATSRGYGAPEVEEAQRRARSAYGAVPEPRHLFPLLRSQHALHLVRAELAAAQELALQCVRLAESTADPSLIAEADLAIGETHFHAGELKPSRECLERAVARLDRPGVALGFRANNDPRVAALAHASWTLWLMGDIDQSLDASRRSLALAIESGQPFSRAFAHSSAATLHQLRGEPELVRQHADTTLEIAEMYGFAFFAAAATMLRGWSLALGGDAKAGLGRLRAGLEAWEETGTGLGKPFILTLVAEAHAAAGQPPTALRLLDEAVVLAERTGERWYEAEIRRLAGEAVLAAYGDRRGAAGRFRAALDVAQRAGSNSLALRAVVSLARLQPRNPGAREVLAGALGALRSRLDTGDTRAARHLLALPETRRRTLRIVRSR